MTSSDSQTSRGDRIERIKSIVEEDYHRIQATDNPYQILNLPDHASPEQVKDRYERYERFYRAENFQRLGNMDLTRKALDVRRSIGRAMVRIQAEQSSQPEPASKPTKRPGADTDLPSVDPDAAAMGDIYFRDALSYLSIGDLSSACEYFQRACDYDPSRGIIRAHLAYTEFKRNPTHEETVKRAGRQLRMAADLAPNNVEVFALLARFGINDRDNELAHSAIKRMEALDPSHPQLARLKKRAHYEDR